MMRFFLAAAARLRTSNVAITVVAIPLTGVSGSPAWNVSVGVSRHVGPNAVFRRAIRSRAVGGDAVARGYLTFTAAAREYARKFRRESDTGMAGYVEIRTS